MKDTNTYKKLLEAEKSKLIKELETVGQKNSKIPGEWQAVPTDLDSDSADENETADEIEEFETNSSIVEKLEAQLKDVEKALGKIANQTYGQCEKCGKDISIERLNANPAALTCVDHAK